MKEIYTITRKKCGYNVRNYIILFIVAITIYLWWYIIEVRSGS